VLSIGEFSQVTHLTIKTIRLYHEKGLLPPSHVDSETGYRYYDRACVERARIIAELRGLDFSLAEIGEILASGQDEADILAHLERQRARVAERQDRYRAIGRSLDAIIEREKEARMVAQGSSSEVQEKTVEPLRIAGIRIRGKYSDCGKLFARLCRSLWKHTAGKPFNLYYDGEYKESDADLEACIPVKPGLKAEGLPEGISVRELPGGRCVSLIHRGPYEELGRSYEVVFRHIRERGLKTLLPSREIYIKGPGMIFRGNPKKYLTEIQVMVEG